MRSLPRSTRKWLPVASLVVLFALLGALAVNVLPGGPAPGAPPSVVATPIALVTGTVTSPAATPSISLTPPITVTLTAAPPLTPTLITASTAILTPTSPATLVLEGITIPARKAAFIRNKDVWVAESGRGEQALTAYGDVEAIFGWNKDATMLLIGRGRKVQGPHIGDTTDLWLIDSAAKSAKPLTSGSKVHSAAWSPVDDRIAYCERGTPLNVLSVADVAGKVLRQLSNAVCFFSWSPEGSSIAVVTATPESVADTNVEIYDFLTIWQLADGHTLQIRTASGLIYDPTWSMDSRTVIFQLAKAGIAQSVWHVADGTTGASQQLPNTPKIIADFVSRSATVDLLAFRIDQNIYAMDFGGQIQVLSAGKAPTWLPNGKTIIYRDKAGKLTLLTHDLGSAPRQGRGRSRSAIGLYSPPDYFLTD